MKFIENRQDIETLVNAFYKQVVKDDKIGIFFTKIIAVDWDKHMPTMYNFWESILLGNPKYRGNPMLKHQSLNRKQPLLEEHFNRWIELWEETVKKYFEGEKADEAVQRAKQIANLMKYKIKQ